MKQHQAAKEIMRKTQTDNLVRRGKMVMGGSDSRTEEQLRQDAEYDPQGFLRDAIVEEANEQAQQAYDEAQSRARDIQMLVRSINEVASMFQDLAVLVQRQSEKLDIVENHVDAAVSFVKKGNKELRQAIAKQRCRRKCLCALVCTAIIIVGILIAGLLAYFKGGVKAF